MIYKITQRKGKKPASRLFLFRLYVIIIVLLMATIPEAGSQDLVLENLFITDQATYSSIYSIFAGPDFTISSTGAVTLSSGGAVSLKPGFVVINGGVLHVKSADAVVRFQVDMTDELQHVNAGDIIGVRGSHTPFDWQNTISLSDPEGDNIYWLDLDFTGMDPNTLISYKFVHHAPPLDNSTSVTWETSPGVTPPSYNRELTLSGSHQILPVVLWNNGDTDISQEQNVSMKFKLHQNYPNPANPITTIEYAIPKSAHVTITIHTLTGALVKRYIPGSVTAGTHSIRWNGRDESGYAAASGVYVYQITAKTKDKTFIDVKKMIFMK